MGPVGCLILHASREWNKERHMDLIIEHPVLALEPGQVVTLDDAENVSSSATSDSHPGLMKGRPQHGQERRTGRT